MLIELSVKTDEREEFIDITARVREAVHQMGLTEGVITVYVPHTTAAVTINENADPDVVHDVLYALDKAFPNDHRFRHTEGNSTAHIKSSVIGTSVQVIVHQGRLVLGTWQGIYFCEFDGPRHRSLFITGLSSAPVA